MSIRTQLVMAHQTCAFAAPSLWPWNRLIRRCCLIHLKSSGVRACSGALGLQFGAHALTATAATAATNALDHHANIATPRSDVHRKTRPEDSPMFKVVDWKVSAKSQWNSTAQRVRSCPNAQAILAFASGLAAGTDA